MRSSLERTVPILRLLALVLATAGALTACGGGNSTSAASSSVITTTASTPSVATSTPATTTSATAAEGFVSKLYHYSLKSPDWTGTSAQTAWDGKGSPGDGDPTVDSLVGPESARAFVYAGPTKTTLKRFVAKARATNAKVRACPAKPEKTESTTIDGEPAILDELHCGVFALSADAIHAGWIYVFFTYDQPGKEAAMRKWFRSLLETVSFSP